ncbi:sigma-54-dependent transcriptional regulator [Tundrisphaera lichenicola]|uniref:sigma-54-dependent transcriptional regulator n=1 Tax=Tundrisphaera lichenicola TaxID=2029860 RepID=UPI003EBC9887
MAWIPHLMILDDDPRVLESLIPSFPLDLARDLGRDRATNEALHRGDPGGGGAIHVKVSAHGYESDRLASYRYRSPHHVHLHLVRERGGRFDLARKLLNEQLFAVVVSDLRFSDDAGGLRAGQLFIDEAARVHPEVQGLLYSAYPRPEGFPADRFLRKGEGSSAPGLAETVVRSVERHLSDPSVAAFAKAVADLGIIYQTESFGSTLAQLFDLARLFGAETPAPKGPGRSRRPLPCLLLDGESGTGKRGLAELFHASTDRRKAPMTVASCNELTNETLLRSILFGHKRGAFTDAREDRPGLVASAGKGIVLLDDFHRLPNSCSAILHSFLEDGEYSRLGEEEIRRQAEAAAVLTVETGPWQERRRSGELPLAFLARVERLPLEIPPLRERPDDIEAQARWLTRVVSTEMGAELELAEDAVQGLRDQPFAESNSRELRNVIERAILRHGREVDTLEWSHLAPFLASTPPVRPVAPNSAAPASAAASGLNDWQRRLRTLASKILAKGVGLDSEEARTRAESLFDLDLPPVWAPIESARESMGPGKPIPLPVWEDLYRCYAVSRLGGPSPAERVLGIPANTLRQWINDRESR